MKKIFVGMILMFTVVGSWFLLCLFCIVGSDDISGENYSRLAQEIVTQSLEPLPNACVKDCVE